MTEATQETIKFARNWLENGIEDEPSPVTVHELAKAVVELADEIEALNYANASLGVKINGKKAKIKNLVSDLAALKEKTRWRDENVEPAPRGERVLVYCIDYDASDGVHDTEMEHMYCPDGELAYPYTWWRPLDLPEEEAEPSAK